MKKIIKLLIIVFLVFELLFASIKVFAATATVNENEVRFRRKPEDGTEIIDLFNKGTEVEIIEEDGDWYKVRYIDEENARYVGYIKKENLNINGEENTVTENTNKTEKNTVNETTNSVSGNSVSETSQKVEENMKIKITHKLDIRILPLINSSKIGTIDANTEVFISEIVGNWSKIETDNASGWVWTGLI